MALNLVQHRGDDNVWDRTGGAEWDTERWLVSAAAAAILVAGFRRRSPAGFLLAMAGSGLAWWATAAQGERQTRRGRVIAALPRRGARAADPVVQASEESFPASDAPSWTPSTGGPATDGRHVH